MKKIVRRLVVLAVILVPACGLLIEEGRKVMAEIDREPIRLEDFMRRLRKLPFDERARTNDPNPVVRLQARKAILDLMVNEKLIVMEAEARGIVVAEETVREAIEAEHEKRDSMGELTEGIGGDGTTHEHMHEDAEPSRSEIQEMREKLMIEKLLETTLSNAALLKYYEEHPDEFAVNPPRISCELIIVGAADRALIDAVLEKATTQKINLETALAFAEGPKRVIFAGRTPLTPLDQIVPAMREKILDLEPGEISEPFVLRAVGQEQYGIARVLNRLEHIPFERAQGLISRKVYENLLEGLRGKHKVVYNDEALNYRLGD